MSISRHVQGVRDLDAKFQDMMDVKLACDKAGIDYPEAICEYFEYPAESENYLRKEKCCVPVTYTEGTDDGEDIIMVKIEDIPEDVNRLLFITSY